MQETILKKLVTYFRKKGATRVVLFGSYARGDDNPKSDIDLLVRFKSTKSLMELVELQDDASTLAGKKIDLIAEKALHPLLKGIVARDSKVLFG